MAAVTHATASSRAARLPESKIVDVRVLAILKSIVSCVAVVKRNPGWNSPRGHA